ELQKEITALLLQRGEQVLVTRSAAEIFGRRRRNCLIAAALGLFLIGGGLLAWRYLAAPSTVSAGAQQLQPGEALAARKQALPVLLDALADPSPDVRLSVVTALGLTRDPTLRPRIEPLLGDARPDVQSQAATTL